MNRIRKSQFSIKFLLFAMLFVGMGAGWYVSAARFHAQNAMQTRMLQTATSSLEQIAQWHFEHVTTDLIPDELRPVLMADLIPDVGLHMTRQRHLEDMVQHLVEEQDKDLKVLAFRGGREFTLRLVIDQTGLASEKVFEMVVPGEPDTSREGWFVFWLPNQNALTPENRDDPKTFKLMVKQQGKITTRSFDLSEYFPASDSGLQIESKSGGLENLFTNEPPRTNRFQISDCVIRSQGKTTTKIRLELSLNSAKP